MGTTSYNGSLTSEQFLFYEMRIASKFYLGGVPVEEAAAEIRAGNLFQYPTERKVTRMVRACYRRLEALGSHVLAQELAIGPMDAAKQINLYALMRYNRLVWEFMIQVIGEKFRTQDFSFERKDLNAFFARLQAQHDSVAHWSDSTVDRIKGVLVRCLVETEFLESARDTTLRPVFLCEELERGIYENHDLEALIAFNCFR